MCKTIVTNLENHWDDCEKFDKLMCKNCHLILSDYLDLNQHKSTCQNKVVFPFLECSYCDISTLNNIGKLRGHVNQCRNLREKLGMTSELRILGVCPKCCKHEKDNPTESHKTCKMALKCFKCNFRTCNDKTYKDHYVICHLKQGLLEHQENLKSECQRLAGGSGDKATVMTIKDLWVVLNEKRLHSW